MNTNHSKTTDPEGVVDKAIAAVETLDAIASDVDHFILDWAQRVQRQLKCEDQASEPVQQLQLQTEQFEKEKSEWRSYLDQENERIKEKLEQLADAWLHLEAERRQFLQVKQNVHFQQIEGIQQSQVGARTDDVASVSAPTSTSPHCTDALDPLASNASIRDAITAETAVRQFQRLRHEILSSRRN